MTRSPQSNRASIGDKVAFLCSPESYPERPLRVEGIETHMSWVFLNHNRVYKLKKPVRYDFLDFSTLAARHRNCEREVDLNRRLAPAMYRGTMPLTLARDGRLHIDGEGRVVDWLVVMRRLPGERMLDHAIIANSVTAGDTLRLAHLLADFYRRAKPMPAVTTRYCKHFAEEIDANRAELVKPDYGLPVRLIAQVTHQVLKKLHDAPGNNLIRFYKAFCATMRAKIAIWHLADRHINHAAHWRRRARAYLAMALRYAPHDATTIRTAA
jgi:aminoglycoside phosphotransferase family enzyme